jgi:hypothetical protein
MQTPVRFFFDAAGVLKELFTLRPSGLAAKTRAAREPPSLERHTCKYNL